MITNFHAKYYAHDLTRRAAAGIDRLSMSLFDAAVDLTPIRSKRPCSPCNRRLLVICPASIRKQLALELNEKFNLPALALAAKGYYETLNARRSSLNEKAVIIISSSYTIAPEY